MHTRSKPHLTAALVCGALVVACGGLAACGETAGSAVSRPADPNVGRLPPSSDVYGGKVPGAPNNIPGPERIGKAEPAVAPAAAPAAAPVKTSQGRAAPPLLRSADSRQPVPGEPLGQLRDAEVRQAEKEVARAGPASMRLAPPVAPAVLVAQVRGPEIVVAQVRDDEPDEGDRPLPTFMMAASGDEKKDAPPTTIRQQQNDSSGASSTGSSNAPPAGQPGSGTGTGSGEKK